MNYYLLLMKRREFLKKTGMASAALATLPTLINTLSNATPAFADDNQTNFHFVAVSIADPTDLVILNGDGKFGPSNVNGGGSFTHFNPTGFPPFPIVASGTWKARRLVSFTPVGTYGADESGTLVIDVDLIPASGIKIPGTITVNCNIPPGGLSTGSPEGVTLVVDGLTFVPTGTGATVFTTGNEHKD